MHGCNTVPDKLNKHNKRYHGKSYVAKTGSLEEHFELDRLLSMFKNNVTLSQIPKNAVFSKT